MDDQKKIAELTAQVERLRELCDVIATEEQLWNMGDLQGLLSETPAQSLAEIQAEAIAGAIQMVYHEEDDHRGYYSREGLIAHITHIRQEANR